MRKVLLSMVVVVALFVPAVANVAGQQGFSGAFTLLRGVVADSSVELAGSSSDSVGGGHVDLSNCTHAGDDVKCDATATITDTSGSIYTITGFAQVKPESFHLSADTADGVHSWNLVAEWVVAQSCFEGTAKAKTGEKFGVTGCIQADS